MVVGWRDKMKKIGLSLVAIMMMFVLIPLASAKEKVAVYMFTKDGCPACEYAEEYFAGLLEDNPDLFELINIEVFDEEWQVTTQEGYNLLVDLLTDAGEDTSKIATPTISIGDYLTVGVSSTDDLYNAIIARRDAENPVDKAKDFAETKNIDVEKIRKKDPNEVKEEESGKYDALIVIGIFAFLIGGFAGLVILGKKGN